MKKLRANFSFFFFQKYRNFENLFNFQFSKYISFQKFNQKKNYLFVVGEGELWLQPNPFHQLKIN